MNPDDIKEALKLLAMLEEMKEALHYEDSLRERETIEKKMNAPGFWDNPEAARKTVEQFKSIKAAITPFENLAPVAGNEVQHAGR